MFGMRRVSTLEIKSGMMECTSVEWHERQLSVRMILRVVRKADGGVIDGK